jgi:uncharacterized membrane protein YfcA
MNHELLMILFGVGVGLLVGATGVGGGSIMTPLLVLVSYDPVLGVFVFSLPVGNPCTK